MKTIGLLGGMSWESTLTYYQIINEVVRQELGGFHSAKILLHSVDFAEIEQYQSQGEWEKAGDVLAQAASGLERSGADLLVICTNTMHKVAPRIQSQINIPLLHIADATAALLHAAGITKVTLLGTKYTMTQDFYRDQLVSKGIEVLIPDSTGVNYVNSVIYEELVLGIINEESRAGILRIIEELRCQGAAGVILGCTEIGLLIQQAHTDLPIFDTTLIHAKAAALHALG